MNETRELLERVGGRFTFPERAFEGLATPTRSQARNQRIAAGVVGIAIFVAAVLDRDGRWAVRSHTDAGRFRRGGYRTDRSPRHRGRPDRPASRGSDAERSGARTARPLPRGQRERPTDRALGVRRRAPDLGRCLRLPPRRRADRGGHWLRRAAPHARRGRVPAVTGHLDRALRTRPRAACAAQASLPFLTIRVRNGDRLVLLDVGCEENYRVPKNPPSATPQQASALEGISALLADPTSWPASASENQDLETFVSSRY